MCPLQPHRALGAAGPVFGLVFCCRRREIFNNKRSCFCLFVLLLVAVSPIVYLVLNEELALVLDFRASRESYRGARILCLDILGVTFNCTLMLTPYMLQIRI